MNGEAIGAAAFGVIPVPSPAGSGVVAVDRSEPMDASALAVAIVPELTVTMLGDAGGSGALLVVRQYGAAVALIELGDGYLLDIDRARASVLLSNAGTGLRTTIWGEDAAIALADGAEAARFWGNVTFALDNGAVITAATARRDDNPLVYMLDSLTVTRHDAAVVVANLAAAPYAGAEIAVPAPLAITASDDGGWTVEYETMDGLVLEQDAARSGWVREGHDIAADAAWLAETAPGAAYGPESSRISGREFGQLCYRLTTGWTELEPLRRIPDRQPEDNSRRDADRTAELRRIYLASLRPRRDHSA